MRRDPRRTPLVRATWLQGPLALLAGTVLSLAFLLVDNAPFLHDALSRGQPPGRDFFTAWTAGQLASQGRFDDIYDAALLLTHLPQSLQDSGAVYHYAYSPQILPLLKLLGALPYPVALALWTALGYALLLLVALPYSRDARVALLLLLAPAAVINASFGQTGLISAALLVGALRLLSTQPIAAGILLGLLTFKPQMGLLLPVALLAARQFKAFGAATLTTLATMAASWLLLGQDAWAAWLRHEPWVFSRAFLEYGSGAGVLMQVSPFISVRQLTGSLTVAWLIQALCSLAAAACIAWLFGRRTRGFGREQHPAEHTTLYTFTALVAAGLIATPYAHNYDMVALGLCALALLMLAKPGSWEGALLSAVWLAPPMVLPLGVMGLPITPLLVIALLVLCCVRASRQPVA
ncbi:MAG: DUF2029 domain-containing protein [Gammaproteobacteria bacterium]|nr:DUF2029 domain-containing protein [Gammaproteobacteria bacterium]